MLNRAILMGRITRDIELRQTTGGVSVVNFSIAVDRNYQPDKDNKQTDFITITAWRGTAEFISKYFSKGQLIAVEGSIQTRNYQDKEGNNRTAFEVVADQAYFAEGRRSIQPEVQNNIAKESFPADISDFAELDDDCPF